jgi:hypothetical protein
VSVPVILERTTRNFTLSVALAIAFAVPEVSAQSADTSSASTTFQIKGFAPQVCQLPGQAAVAGAVTNATYSSNIVTLTDFIDSTTAFVKGSTLTLKFDRAMCNYEAYLSLSSQNGGMTSSDAKQAAAGDFLSRVDYTVTANWGSISNLVLDTSKAARSVNLQSAGANSGPLTLTFATKDGTVPVVNGNYTDTVTVQIGAKL